MLGSQHIKAIATRLVKTDLAQIEARGAQATAHTTRQDMDAVFACAINSGIGNSNPAVQVKGALAPIIRTRRPAILEIEGLRSMLRRIEAEPAYPPTKLAFRLLALSACRPSEVAGAEWREFEQLLGSAPIWRIPPHRMKTGRACIPLRPGSRRVVETPARFQATRSSCS